MQSLTSRVCQNALLLKALFCLNEGRFPIYRNKGVSDKKATLNEQ